MIAITLIGASLLVLLSVSGQAKGKEVKITHKVTFTMQIGGRPIGDIVIGLFGDVVPRTAANFATFASEQGYQGLTYRGSKFHRVIPRFMIQGGDINNGDGTGSVSIFGGKYFDDENFILKHTEKGLLSMANAGKDTNGSQFFITVTETPWLDGKHTVFGKVLRGMEVVDQIEATPTNREDHPVQDVVIVSSTMEEVNEKIQLHQ